MKPPKTHDWVQRAACLQVPKAVFYPEARSLKDYDLPRSFCDGCPVKGWCLAQVLEEEMPGWRFGFRGGMTPTERKWEYRRRFGTEARFHITADAPHAGGRQGTARGYQAHIRLGEIPCDDCILGSRAERRERQRAIAAALGKQRFGVL